MELGKHINKYKSIISSSYVTEQTYNRVGNTSWSQIRDIIPVRIFQLLQQYINVL